MSSMGSQRQLEITAFTAFTLAVCLASVLLRGKPAANVAPLGLALTVLMAGYDLGPLYSWLAALGCGLFALGLYNFDMIRLPTLAACLLAYSVVALYPLPWHRRRDQTEAAFRRNIQPLKEARDLALEQLKRSKADLESGRQRTKESDALFQAAREISKVLTLNDMVDFSVECLAQTLKRREVGAGKGGMFVLMLADEEGRRYRLAASMGLAVEEAKVFECEASAQSLVGWLGAQAKPLQLDDAQADPAMRRLQVPRIVKSCISIPLVIRDELMGMVVVFDMLPSAFSRETFNDLKVLGNQLSIGIKKAMLYDKVQRLSITDGLTGLYVHRYLQERLDEEIRRASRYGMPVSFLMVDIDFFKKYNDSYGHLAGDEVLKRVSGLLARGAEPSDLVARYGGEEFALILPNQGPEAAQAKAEVLRKAVEAERFNFEGAETRVTISCGLATFPLDAKTKSGLIDRSDQALYQAKSQGRNRVVCAGGAS